MSERILNLKCLNGVLTVVSDTGINSGGKNYNKVKFEVDSEWNGYAKSASFILSEDVFYQIALDNQNEAFIPREVINTERTIEIGLYGVSGDSRITSSRVRIRINAGGYCDGTSQPEAPDVIGDLRAQINSKLDDARHSVNRTHLSTYLQETSPVKSTSTAVTSIADIVNLIEASRPTALDAAPDEVWVKIGGALATAMQLKTSTAYAAVQHIHDDYDITAPNKLYIYVFGEDRWFTANYTTSSTQHDLTEIAQKLGYKPPTSPVSFSSIDALTLEMGVLYCFLLRANELYAGSPIQYIYILKTAGNRETLLANGVLYTRSYDSGTDTWSAPSQTLQAYLFGGSSTPTTITTFNNLRGLNEYNRYYTAKIDGELYTRLGLTYTSAVATIQYINSAHFVNVLTENRLFLIDALNQQIREIIAPDAHESPKLTFWNYATSSANNFTVPTSVEGTVGDIIIVSTQSGDYRGGKVFICAQAYRNVGTGVQSYTWVNITDTAAAIPDSSITWAKFGSGVQGIITDIRNRLTALENQLNGNS